MNWGKFMSIIPYGRQDIKQEDIDAVNIVLKSDFITQGPVVPQFEKAVSKTVNAKHGIAVNSGTSALHIACMAFGLSRDDILWTVPNTFVASANCGRYCGAKVDFVDIDPSTWNISVHKLREKLVQAKKDKCLPKVVVPVHFAGQPTEQDEIRELSEEYGFYVLEDASHSLGGSRNGEPVGSCKWSDITTFSFHPVKIITSAEGGMAMTNDDELAEKMSMLRSHGITRDQNLLMKKDPDPWYYEQHMLGYNYRMTDIHAALGLSQLKNLRDFIDIRNRLAARYDNELKDLSLQLPTVSKENRSAFHLYVIRIKKENSKKNHREIFDEMRSNGIGVNLHYIPVHLQPYYRNLGFKEGQFPESEIYSREAITIPLYPKMTEGDQDAVISALYKVMKE